MDSGSWRGRWAGGRGRGQGYRGVYHGGMDEHELLTIANGYRSAAVLTTAAHVGLFDALADGPHSAEEVAGSLNTDLRATRLLLNALVALRCLDKAPDAYALRPELEPLLVSTSPSTVVHIIRHAHRSMGGWARLDEVLETGGPLPRERRSEEGQREFLLAMDDLARCKATDLGRLLPLADRRHLIDVGGGGGRYALGALAAHPGLTATVVDLPESEPFFEEVRAQAAPALAERLAFQPVDVLEGPLPHADAALVSSLVHSFGPDQIRLLAGNLAAALEPGAMLAVRDFFFDGPDYTSPRGPALFAINMLLHTAEGGCYSAADLEGLFGPAGFHRWRTIDIEVGVGLLLGLREGE